MWFRDLNQFQKRPLETIVEILVTISDLPLKRYQRFKLIIDDPEFVYHVNSDDNVSLR